MQMYHPTASFSDLTVRNVEALAQEEDNVIDLWCCGNTDKCAMGEKVVIIGKMSAKPCK